MIRTTILLLIFLYSLNACVASGRDEALAQHQSSSGEPVSPYFDTTFHTIHVKVALCDNQYQGIVPVPAKIGNGRDPAQNLYWGCAFGVRSFFRNSKEWELLRTVKVDDTIAERLVFRHRANRHWYLVADAYYGEYIRRCTVDFLDACSGRQKDTMHIADGILGIGGNSRLLAYVGHDGLMDFTLEQSFSKTDERTRDAIILACISKRFFAAPLRQTGARPLLWSTSLMSPEAYTLHAALEAYIKGMPPEACRAQAAKAYATYQHCGMKAAMGLLVSGY